VRLSVQSTVCTTEILVIFDPGNLVIESQKKINGNTRHSEELKGHNRMIYPIVRYGDPVLEKPSEPITEFNGELRKLADDMFESMYAAHGVGLAAPQIGIGKRIVVIDVTFKEDPDARLVLVNPEIIKTEGRQRGSEGCLSLPDFREDVTRANKVTVRAQDLEGKWFEKTGEEMLARAFLHETDHLNGKLYISHISSLKRDLIKRKVKKLMRAGEW